MKIKNRAPSVRTCYDNVEAFVSLTNPIFMPQQLPPHLATQFLHNHTTAITEAHIQRHVTIHSSKSFFVLHTLKFSSYISFVTPTLLGLHINHSSSSSNYFKLMTHKALFLRRALLFLAATLGEPIIMLENPEGEIHSLFNLHPVSIGALSFRCADSLPTLPPLSRKWVVPHWRCTTAVLALTLNGIGSTEAIDRLGQTPPPSTRPPAPWLKANDVKATELQLCKAGYL